MMTMNALTVIEKPQDLALFQQGYVEQYEEEVTELNAKLDEAREALELAGAMQLHNQIAKQQAQVSRLEKQLEAASAYLSFYRTGFLPLPRMPLTDLKWTHSEIPVVALRRLKKAKELGLFDEFGIVEPQVNRDPILVGIKRFEDGQEVHCFIAWWR